MKLYINHHTGAGNEWVEVDSLNDAKNIADEAASYTQESITIEDEDGNELTRRTWYGYHNVDDESECENPIRFGTFGFYGDWSF